MKHMTKVSLVVVTAAAVTFGGSVYAFADWIIDTPRAVLKMRTAAMPAGNSPSVAKNGKNAAIDWVGNKILAGVPAESYIVTRFGAGDPVVVCDHVTATTCKDKAVPGGTWTWKVQPVLKTWIGDHSPPSVALTFSGSPPTAAELVSATSSAAPLATPVAPTGGTAPGSDTKAVTSPPAAPATTDEPPAATAPEPEEPDAPPPVAEESTPVDPAQSVTPAEDQK
ncbi:hypothetical protein ACQP2Y_42225 [Actinoplanes sp. CA-051413]|uniref:hypothetical protein n=1 Tax=Actinoplanes sp. CA-051413 TaxID=3239899 RepID=UPI003D96D498